MRSKFEITFESYAGRFTKGGFYPGDFVKFKDDALKDASIQSGDSSYIDKIKEFMDGDLNLRIGRITGTSATKSANADGTADQYVATVYQTYPGHSTTSTDNVITVPLCVLDKVADAADETQVKVPDSFKRETEKLSHTNRHKASADFQDDSYDSGKDFNSGSRDQTVEGTPESLKKDSEASGVKKTKRKK
jgi:hypothetical protein